MFQQRGSFCRGVKRYITHYKELKKDKHFISWNRCFTCFFIVLDEQIIKYVKLESEAFTPKQELCLLQNNVGDVAELSYMKQIGDQDVACRYQPLTYESYMELLLYAFSTYDKKLHLPGKQKRAV
jgi:hypothetical protein